ncbi:hypothetical protein G9A89_020269 [Geosiphon pyriformis]|nr:hypothetical protein G9A89_020269 [Geosiphon pyriformis]
MVFATIPWEITDSEKEKSNDQETSKQNPILENSEIKTLVNQTPENQNDQNSDQQQLQSLSQQQIQQQPQQQPMTYAPIAKIEKFTGKENDIQGKTEAVTTYLRHFHRNLCQIQAIQADYFTVPQILNQFIHGLHSITNTKNFELAELEANYAQAVNLVMNRSSDLDSKLKQLSDSINQKLEGYLETQIISKISCIHHHLQISHSNKRCMSAITVVNKAILELTADFILSTQLSTISTELPTYNATANILTTNLSALSICHLSNTVPTHLSVTVSNNLSTPTNSNTTTKLISKWNPKAKTDTTKLEINLNTGYTQNLSSQNYLSLLVTPENILSDNVDIHQTQPLTSNILPATSTEDKSLVTIFPFDLDKITPVLLFSGVTLNTKPITAMYINAKVNDQPIKLIFDNCRVDHAASAKIIMANRATKTSIGKIDDFSFKVNGIIITIKVLIMKATQY